ncbi:cob(I)alamin adenosyltransferase [Saccharicrinis carchari]|uniref:corrinoid adenosyltransferase n=1 Tax=Saccharicrinis carchari TaxID=1168039 RepID=A0A521E435_SACCC|nr:cob(I)yrinic acid a,c-diamide adenosyltransferase [Saccharicrinis carchari]SMO78724.1 cob(I)alamin adenosyltransferase [Saccharicrinis carchari]
MKGYIQVYTGNGKGKTTAAIGLAIRALGAGKKVFFAQFVKGMEYAEHKILKALSPDITIRLYGLDCFIEKIATVKDIEAAKSGLKEVAGIIRSGKYDLVILDEANIALFYNLFSVEELLSVIDKRADGLEIVVTGRKAPEKLKIAADLVTEMKEIKHYYQKGIEARKGMEF